MPTSNEARTIIPTQLGTGSQGAARSLAKILERYCVAFEGSINRDWVEGSTESSKNTGMEWCLK